MKLSMTITNSMTGISYDFQLDQGQKIGTTLKVLKEGVSDLFNKLTEPVFLLSLRSSRRLLLEQTYEEAHIYSGDELLLIDHKGYEEGMTLDEKK